MRYQTLIKILPAILFITCSYSALATDLQPAGDKPVIIDGKKFFPLQNAHRFHGTPKQPVIIKPRQPKPHVIASPGTKSAIIKPDSPSDTIVKPDNATQQNKLPMTAPQGSNSTNLPDKTSKDILSIFSPEDKGTSNSSIQK